MTRPFLALLALAVLLAVGCSTHTGPVPKYSTYSHAPAPPSRSYAPEIIPVYVDKAFRADAREDIHVALDEWNYAFNGYRMYLVVSDAFDFDLDVIAQVERTKQGLIVLSVPDYWLDENVPSNVLAWVDELGDPVVHVASGRIGTRDLKKIVMHEIGHTLGLPHTVASGTLMSQYYQDQVSCIDEYTVRTLTGLRYSRAVHWLPQFMNSCPLS